MSDWIQSEYHVSISGQTGAGKTYLANKIHKSVGGSQNRLSVFLNTQHEQYVYGYTVRSVGQIQQRLSEGTPRYGLCFNYLPGSTSGEREHEQLVQLLLENETPALLVTDEAHEIAGTNDSSTSLHRAVKRGRRWSLKNLVLSQRPSAVSNDVLTQCRYHAWVGRPAEFEKQYLESYGFPYQQMTERGDHEITVVEGGNATVYEPV